LAWCYFLQILPSRPLPKPGGCCLLRQELRPKSLDIKQEELGDMVEKEMASTSEAIEDAVRRIEVRRS